MSKQSFIAVVGSANVDLTPSYVTLPRPGETIFGKKFDLGFGGKAPTKLSPLASAARPSQWSRKLGSDLFGPATIKNFQSQGIDADPPASPRVSQAATRAIFVEPGGRTGIIVVKGAKRHALAPKTSMPPPRLRKPTPS